MYTQVGKPVFLYGKYHFILNLFKRSGDACLDHKIVVELKQPVCKCIDRPGNSNPPDKDMCLRMCFTKCGNFEGSCRQYEYLHTTNFAYPRYNCLNWDRFAKIFQEDAVHHAHRTFQRCPQII